MARINFGPKTASFPEMVYIIGTYNEDGTANAMNAAWGGIYDTNRIFVSLSSHKTTDNIKRTQAFTISFGTKDMVKACDAVGLISGNKLKDKAQKVGLTAITSSVEAPNFMELPVSLECKVYKFIEDEDGIKLIGDIINVSADEKVVSDNKVDVTKLMPIAFDSFNHKYYCLSEVVDDAFKCGKELLK